jgi:hypothetical protein
VQAERVAKLRTEIRRERDAIAALRAEWALLDNPARIQALAQRHLALKQIDPTQIDSFDHLPMRPATAEPPSTDAIAAVIENLESQFPTGSLSADADTTPTGSIGTAPGTAGEAIR